MSTYVHSHTTDTWPAVPLGLVLVVGTTSLQDGLVNTSTSSNHTCNTGQSSSNGVRIQSHSSAQTSDQVYNYTAPHTITSVPQVRHSGSNETWALEDIKGSYQQQLCWLKRWLSWSLRAAWLWTSWSRGCGRWLWHSFLKRGPVCLCRRAFPPRSRWWFPQALCRQAGHCQCSAELWVKT